ncbi:hypothetical protein GGR57DRAFT_415807 [Xylariaceae sp. FL1272]|nr:hypothetical protein GGR57DRAFT_415807 [Xylariaceae sp. FL1272]
MPLLLHSSIVLLLFFIRVRSLRKLAEHVLQLTVALLRLLSPIISGRQVLSSSLLGGIMLLSNPLVTVLEPVGGDGSVGLVRVRLVFIAAVRLSRSRRGLAVGTGLLSGQVAALHVDVAFVDWERRQGDVMLTEPSRCVISSVLNFFLTRDSRRRPVVVLYIRLDIVTR